MERTRQRQPPTEEQVPLDQQMENRRERNRARIRETVSSQKFLSTGSTMLNLAMSDNINGGWPLGNINTMPGKSAAGKTVVVLSTFSEACIVPRFDGYDLIYDEVERRCDFNFQKLFPPLLDRLITPNGTKYRDLPQNMNNSGISNTIEDVEISIMTRIKSKKPFIYVVDSLDSLSTDEEEEKEMLRAIAAAKSKEAADKISQAHAARKAGVIHRVLRNANAGIANTNSMILFTQQLKQKIDAKPFERKWTTNGGEGPFFYSQVRPFLTRVGTKKDLGCEIGVETEVIMDKNSVTGKLRNIEFTIYYDLGIDDIDSMVGFLLDTKHWQSGSWIEAPEFNLKENGRDKLVRKIEQENLERGLKRIVQTAWDKREEKLKLDRKPRY